jgi:hypothetical protein
MLLFILCALYLHRRIVRLDLVRMLLVPLGAVSVAGACVMLLPVPPVAVMLSAIVAAWLVLAATERRRWNPATARADLGTVTR